VGLIELKPPPRAGLDHPPARLPRAFQILARWLFTQLARLLTVVALPAGNLPSGPSCRGARNSVQTAISRGALAARGNRAGSRFCGIRPLGVCTQR
jgi:hypothetical protein